MLPSFLRPWTSRDSNNSLHTRCQIVLKVFVVFVLIRLWHEHADILADQFHGRVAEQPPGRQVRRLNCAGVVDRNNCINCGIQDSAGSGFTFRKELSIALLAVMSRLIPTRRCGTPSWPLKTWNRPTSQ